MQASVLDVFGLYKHFGSSKIINDLSLSLYQGEILGLVGPNGAGKTTLFNIISGSSKPDAGEIFIQHINATTFSPHQRCRLGLARTFQIPKPFLQLSVLSNATVGAYFGRKHHISLSEAYKLAETALLLTELEHKKNYLAASLTLAERRKLELARAIATDPKVILLDEIIAGLNSIEVQRMIYIIQKIQQSGVSILMVEHVMKAILQLSKRVLVLYQGKIIAVGTPEEVISDNAVKLAYLGDLQYDYS